MGWKHFDKKRGVFFAQKKGTCQGHWDRSRVYFSKDVLLIADKGYIGIDKIHGNSLVPKKSTKKHKLTNTKLRLRNRINPFTKGYAFAIFIILLYYTTLYSVSLTGFSVRHMNKASCPMFWTNSDCPSVCNRLTARNADEKQARTPSKTVSPVRRNNVAFRVDLRSECWVCTRCFDHNYIREYKVLL